MKLYCPSLRRNLASVYRIRVSISLEFRLVIVIYDIKLSVFTTKIILSSQHQCSHVLPVFQFFQNLVSLSSYMKLYCPSLRRKQSYPDSTSVHISYQYFSSFRICFCYRHIWNYIVLLCDENNPILTASVFIYLIRISIVSEFGFVIVIYGIILPFFPTKTILS